MIVIVITVLILVGLFLIYYDYVKKNDLKYKNNKKRLQDLEGKRLITGSCGPGCEFQCDSSKNCPNMKLKNKNKIIMNVPRGQFLSMKPNLQKNLSLSYNSVGGTGGSDCSTNINGVMKLNRSNIYGKTFPEGEQMYSSCIKGSNNPFD